MLELVSEQTNSKAEIAVVVPEGFSFLSLGSLLAPFEFVQEEFPEFGLRTSVYSVGDLKTGVTSSLKLHADLSVNDLRQNLSGRGRPLVVFVCCGHSLPEPCREAVRWLMRDCARYGVRLFGIGAANWLMAETDLLPEDRAAIHWASADAFSERNIDADAKKTLFVSDGRTTSCAGELSTMDLVIDFLAGKFGRQVSQKVCNQFLVSFPRSGETEQPGAAENRLRHMPRILRDMARMMREMIDENISTRQIAEAHEISQRQMERMFQRHLGCSPSQYMKKLRVELALQLCEQTEMEIQSIAQACGFGSCSVLAKHFKRAHGITPREMRRRKTRFAYPHGSGEKDFQAHSSGAIRSVSGDAAGSRAQICRA